MSGCNQAGFREPVHKSRAGGLAAERRTGSNDAGRGNRTPDPRITNALLYQLSYSGTEPESLEAVGVVRNACGAFVRASMNMRIKKRPSRGASFNCAIPSAMQM